jgi:hypothetical protein
VATSFASVPDLLRVLDLTGVFANALLGGAVARRHGFDPVGFAALAIVSGLGGGLIRDTLLQRGTPVALTNYAYLTTALIGAVVAFAVRFEGRLWDRLFTLRRRPGIGLLGGGRRTEDPLVRIGLAAGRLVGHGDRSRRWCGARYRGGQRSDDLRREHAVCDLRGDRQWDNGFAPTPGVCAGRPARIDGGGRGVVPASTLARVDTRRPCRLASGWPFPEPPTKRQVMKENSGNTGVTLGPSKT